MLGEWNGSEDAVDIDDSEAVFAIDNQPDYVDALRDSGKLVEALPKRSGTAIGVRWELAKGIRMKRKCGSVVTPHRINVAFDDLTHLLSRAILRLASRPLRGHSFFHLPTILGRVEMALRRGNQAVAPQTPFLKATNADPVAGPFRSCIRATNIPLILGLVAPYQQVIHYHPKLRISGHERLRHLGDRGPSDGWRVVVHAQRPVLREEGSHTRGIPAAPSRSVTRREISQLRHVRSHGRKSYHLGVVNGFFRLVFSFLSICIC